MSCQCLHAREAATSLLLSQTFFCCEHRCRTFCSQSPIQSSHNSRTLRMSPELCCILNHSFSGSVWFGCLCRCQRSNLQDSSKELLPFVSHTEAQAKTLLRFRFSVKKNHQYEGSLQ